MPGHRQRQFRPQTWSELRGIQHRRAHVAANFPSSHVFQRTIESVLGVPLARLSFKNAHSRHTRLVRYTQSHRDNRAGICAASACAVTHSPEPLLRCVHLPAASLRTLASVGASPSGSPGFAGLRDSLRPVRSGRASRPGGEVRGTLT
jgi:hypothetical protein